MGIVNYTIKNLINGVSQQSPSVRLPSQAELQENGYSTLIDGLGKRPPSRHIAKLLDVADCGSTPGDLFIHYINRDTTERYAVIIGDGTIDIFDLLTGSEVTVTAPDGLDYLEATNPFSAFECVTVADHTFILNKTVTILKTSTASAAADNAALVWIKAGLYSTKYEIVLNGTSVSYTTPISTGDSAQWRTEYIATQLKAGIDALTGYTTTICNGSMLKITKNTGTFTITTSDSYGNQAMGCAKGKVQKYQDLPAKAYDGFKVEVENDPDSTRDNFYLQYSVTGNNTGTWSEVVGYGQYNEIDPATMPHKLVRQSNGTFTFEECEWDDRLTGDTETNPDPSFIGKTAEGLFYYRDRFGILADENVSMSKSGEYYNFFADTAMQTLDTDPIDTPAASTKVSILRHAIPFMEQLFLFADQAQFVLSTNSVLSPNDVQIDQATNYEYDPGVKPVVGGSSVFFATRRGDYTGIHEYLVDPDTRINQALDLTAHVAQYIPKNVFKLTSGTTTNILLALTREERNAIYVYNFWWDGKDKVQSAWSKWTFHANDVILSCEIINSIIYLNIFRPGEGVYLEAIDLMTEVCDSGLQFKVLLDRRATATGTYNAATGITTWTLPYPIAVTRKVEVVRGPDFTGNGMAIPTFRAASTTTVCANGNHTAGECYVGIPYKLRYQLSEQFLKQDSSETVSVTNGRLQLIKMMLRFAKSLFMKAVVTTSNGDVVEYPYSLKIGEGKIGTPVPTNGTFSFPVLARSNLCKVEIQNESHYPCFIQSIDWVGRYIPPVRSNKV
jgi:hypothetical protein